MQRIGLISDSHGPLTEDVLAQLQACDEVWHAGDLGTIEVIEQLEAMQKPIRIVYGNIDGHDIRRQAQETLVFECEGLKVVLHHIAGALGRYTSQMREILALHQPDLLVCGHSHILKVAKDARFDLIYMNPGACGRKGFHSFRTMLKFELDKSTVQQMEAIDFGPRGKRTTAPEHVYPKLS